MKAPVLQTKTHVTKSDLDLHTLHTLTRPGGMREAIKSAAPCLWQAERACWITNQIWFPILGKRSIPQTPNRNRTVRRTSPLSRFRPTFHKSCHPSHALGPLWPTVTTSNCTYESSCLIKNHVFSQWNSFQNVL